MVHTKTYLKTEELCGTSLRKLNEGKKWTEQKRTK